MKKYLPRITACLLSVLVLCAPVFAASGDDAYALYQRAMKKMDSVSSLESEMDITASVSMGDISMSISGEAAVKQVMTSGDKMEMEMLMTMSLGGQKMTESYYYRDGYLYQNSMDQKTKSRMAIDDALAMSYDIDHTLTQEILKSAEVRQVAGGSSISFAMNSDTLSEAMRETLDATYDSMGLTGMKLRLGDIRYTIVVGDDDLVQSYRMVYNATMEYEGISAVITYDIGSRVVSVNKVDRISFPADLDAYVDTTSSQMI